MATKYIDFLNGSDSNDGSRATPWRHAPGMNQASGNAAAYSAGPIDRFLFRGGVTWPVSCFPWTINRPGSGMSAMAYYGAGDTAIDGSHDWFIGSSWTQPVFDFGIADFSGRNGIGVAQPYIVIDNIQFYRFNGGPASPSLGLGSVSTYPLTANNVNYAQGAVRVLNCLFRDWQGLSAYGPWMELGYCEFTQSGILTPATGWGPNGNAGYVAGMLLSPNGSPCTWNVNWVHHCRAHDCGGFMPASQGTFEWNDFGPMYAFALSQTQPSIYDNSQHANALQLFGPSIVTHNLLHDLHGVVSPLTLAPGFNGPVSALQPNYCHDNIIWNVAQNGGYQGSGNPNNITVYCFNNIFYGFQFAVDPLVQGASSYRFAASYCNNNLAVNAPGVAGIYVNSAQITGTSDFRNNILMTYDQATAAGLTIANKFAPPSTSPTINVGIDLSSFHIITDDINGVLRPQGGAWDVGAYEFVGSGRTFYSDFATGSDSNPGTKVAPWKRCPAMAGWAGSYSHQASDRFIFKGGVTWPGAAGGAGTGCWPMTVSNGGTVDNPDYYGTDQTWFAGSSWTRPVFDFQNIILGVGYGVGIQASNVTFGDGIDLKRHRAPTWFGGGGTVTSNGSFTGIRVTNAIIRDWDLATPITDGSGGAGGGVISYGAVIKIDHCTFHQLNSATISGVVAYNVNDVSFCDIGYCAEALHGGGLYHDNHIHNLLDGTDPTTHQAAIVTYIPSTIYNNLIQDLTGRNAPIELWGATSGAVSNSTDLLYNNVVFNGGVQPCIWIGNDSNLYNTHTVKLYNNTLHGGSGFCFSNRASTNAALGTLDMKNNHFISSGTAVNINNPGQLGGPVTNLIDQNNLTQSPTAASSAGYTTTNFLQPTSGASPTVDVGASLVSLFTTDRLGVSRPQGAAWDRGAYEWAGGGATNHAPTGSIVTPASTVSILQGQSVTFAGSGSDQDGDVVSYLWNFGTSGLSTSTLQNPGALTFNTVGTFTVTLTVTDSHGLADPSPPTRTITVAAPTPVCSVSPTTNDFGWIDLGATGTGSLTVTNTGQGTLSGTATASGAPFSVTGDPTYSLGASASKVIAIAYNPTTVGAINSGSISFSGGGGSTVTIRGRSPFRLTFNAVDGIITAPFTVFSGQGVWQAIDTESSGPSAGGLAYFEFTVAVAGDYTIKTSVNAAGDGSNSFYINIDAEPTDPQMVWDIVALTSGFENRQVGWRGTGTFDAPQIPLKTFTLTAGRHRLYLRGREANAKIASFTFEPVVAPVNVPPTAGIAASVTSGPGPLSVDFTLTSHDSDGTVASGILDYGDGGGETITTPAMSLSRNRVYSTPGVYTATWKSIDNNAAMSSLQSVVITVTTPALVPAILYVPL